MMGLGPKLTFFPHKNVSIKCCSSIWSDYMQRILYVATLFILVLLLQGCDG
ncbi:hypothetical protein RYX36_010432 [Vicia faba]